MSRIRKIFIALIGLAVAFSMVQFLVPLRISENDVTVGPDLGVVPVLAAKEELKAGMVDPKTGKKIK